MLQCRILNDEVALKTTDPNEKLAISFAIATSSKLDVFEHRVEETIKETKHIPEDLASTGSIRYSKTDISKLIGRLFIVVCIQVSFLILISQLHSVQMLTSTQIYWMSPIFFGLACLLFLEINFIVGI